jgi:hypothetical protein
MKTAIFLLLLFTGFTLSAQIDLGSRVKNKVNQRVEQKIDQGIDKALDNTEEEAEKAVKGDKDAKKGKSGNDGENASPDEKSSSPEKVPTAPEKATLKTYGKFDFIPSEIDYQHTYIRPQTDAFLKKVKFNITLG